MIRRILLGAALLLLAGPPLHAQQPTRPGPDSARADTARTIIRATQVDTAPADSSRLRVKPRTAFIRSLILPGWGQISAGAYRSAAVFVGLQAASDFMLVKSIGKYSQARNAERDTVAAFLGRLRAKNDTLALKRYDTNPDALNAAIDSLGSFHSLVQSRRQQREDWITLAAFWTLASAADAFVVAQLSDFPADVQVEPRGGGGMLFRIGIKTRRPW